MFIGQKVPYEVNLTNFIKKLTFLFMSFEVCKKKILLNKWIMTKKFPLKNFFCLLYKKKYFVKNKIKKQRTLPQYDQGGRLPI